VHSFAECVRRAAIKEHELKIPTFGRGVCPENLSQCLWLNEIQPTLRVGKTQRGASGTGTSFEWRIRMATEQETCCILGCRISEFPQKSISLGAFNNLGWARLTTEVLDRMSLSLRIWQRRLVGTAAKDNLPTPSIYAHFRRKSADTQTPTSL
jgi:hypothetical protein